MPLTKEQIKQQSIADSWVSPHFGDGGWHGSSFGSEKFDADWQPRHDRILVRRIPDVQSSVIILKPSYHEGRARIVKVGPGKWVSGEWWYHDGQTYNRFYDFRDEGYYWIPGYRKPLDVHPGMQVIIGPHSDWDSYAGEYLLCQEADVRVVLS